MKILVKETDVHGSCEFIVVTENGNIIDGFEFNYDGTTIQEFVQWLMQTDYDMLKKIKYIEINELNKKLAEVYNNL